MFKLRKLITLKTNASNQTIEACISRSNDKKRLHLITFHNKKFTDVELNYELHDKQLLTIADFFKQ